eukprot:gene7858-8708_t
MALVGPNNRLILGVLLAFVCSIIFFVDARSPIIYSSGPQSCGKDVSCFNWPKGCKEARNCKVVVEYQYDKALKLLHVKGGSVGEICLAKSSGKTTLKGFINEGTDFKMKDLPKEVIPVWNIQHDGFIMCSYNRPLQAGYLKILNTSSSWFHIVSWGKLHKDGKRPKEHGTGDYYWSKTKVDLKKPLRIPVATFGWNLIGVHGCLMVLAWVGFGVSGIFYARYAREIWPTPTFRGSPLWFQVHRCFMLASAGLMLIGFFVIIAEAKGWNEELGPHPIMGIIVVVLVSIQVVAGILRPGTNSSWRKVFNWVHRSTGVISFILASVTIFLGLSAVGVDMVVFILYLIVVLLIVVGIEARKIYMSSKTHDVQYREEELDERKLELEVERSDDEPAVMSSRELFIRKVIALFVMIAAFAFAMTLMIMVGHMAYVYDARSKVPS